MKQSIVLKPIYWFVLIVIFVLLAWVEGIQSIVSVVPFLLLVIALVFFELWVRKQSDKLFADCRMAGMISATALACLFLSIVLKSFFSWNSIKGWPAITMLSFLAIRFFFKYRKFSCELAKRQILV